MTSAWNNLSGGVWGVGANWAPASVPGSTTDAIIDLSGDYAVAVQQTATLADLTLADSGATLLVEPVAPLNGVTLDVTGGLDLAAGTLALAGGETVLSSGFAAPLPGLPATTVITPAVLALGGGISADGGAITANFAVIETTASQSFTGATLTLGEQTTLAAAAGTLTLDGSITVNGSGDALSGAMVNDGTLIFASPDTVSLNPDGRAAFTNDGTIAVTAGQVVGNFQTFTNAGEIDLGGGFTLTASDGATNTGSIAIAHGTTLALGLGAPPLGFGAIDNLGEMRIDGAVALAGGTLALAAGSTADLTGTIADGTIANNGGLIVAGGTFDGVTYSGTLALASLGAGAPVTLAVRDGLVVTGGSLAIGADTLQLLDSETLTPSALSLAGGTLAGPASGTLTLGAGETTTTTEDSAITAGHVVNAGTLVVAAGTLTVTADNFANAGSIIVDAGATLDLVLPADAPAPQLGATSGPGAIEIDPPGVTPTLFVADSPPPACFLAGTRIATETGDVAVEALRPGMRVRTASGALAPIIWIGQRRVDCNRHLRPELVQPVRILAGAFAPGIPHRDLCLSPDHAVAITAPGTRNRLLVPVKCLLNGATIVQEDAARAWYFHVELPRHDLLLAEGLTVESYLDTGNRGGFANGGVLTTLYPDFTPLTGWENACAPLCLGGEAVTRMRRRLVARAEILGWRRETDADLHLRLGRATLRPAATHGTRHRFLLPASARASGPETLEILSRSGVPVEPEPARLDYRRLGVCVGAIICDGRPLPLDGPAIGAGFHALEQDDTRQWRWTGGAARLLLPARPRPAVFDLVVLDAEPGFRPPASRRVHQRLSDSGDDVGTAPQNGARARPGRAVWLRG